MTATLAELLVGIGIDTQELTSGAQGAADEVEGSLGGIQAAAAGAAIGGLFAVGLASAMDTSAANSKLTRQLGLTQEESARAGSVAGEVFTAGFGESIAGVNEAIGSVVSSMGGMGKVSDKELKSMTTSALMLADTFDLDVGESTKAAGQMIKQGLVKDGAEAFDVLTVAAQEMPAALRGDIPDIVAEYGIHFGKIGLSAQDAFGMMSQYAAAGGRDLDQAGDVLHEFARITSEESDKAAAAFTGLGLDSKQMLGDIHKGGEPAKQALGKTLEALREIKDPAKQSALAVQLFGDMAGEGADALWAMNPATAATSGGMADVKGAAEAANSAMASSPGQQLESIMRTLSTTLGELLMPALTILGTFLKENPGLVKILVPIILGLAVAIGIAAIAQWAWNTALWASPVTWVIMGIIALIAIIILIIVYWDEIAAACGRAWDWIVSKFDDALNWITGLVDDAVAWLSSAWDDAWAWIERKTLEGVLAVMGFFDDLGKLPGKIAGWLGDIVDWVAGLPQRIGRAASGMWDSLKTNFINVINFLIWKWNNFSLTLGGGSVLGMDVPSVTLHTPNIPYLADGGITTGPTLAMIGEGREDEAVLPLSKLDGMLRSVAGAVRTTGNGRQEARVVFDVTGADDEMKRLISRIVRVDGGGDVTKAFT
ncbi:phage tail tape measure protein [Streptomyces sp. NPDC002994]|uniref:phage tail tape measure protein n=1 Tax=Streptomyces sp. NPDC002994 TaxID=3154441 RepID=UPI0033AE8B74